MVVTIVRWCVGAAVLCAAVHLLLQALVPRATIAEFTTSDGQTYIMESTHYEDRDGRDAVQVKIRPKR